MGKIVAVLKELWQAFLDYISSNKNIEDNIIEEDIIQVPSEPEPWESIELPDIIYRRLEGLYPQFKDKIINFIKKMHHKGYFIYVVMGLRTFQQQDDLYAQGRTKPGNIVTNAKGGQSYHNYGLSIDVAFDADLVKDGVQWSWDDGHPWQEIGKLAEECGLEWGGNWKNMSNDLGHFQDSHGYSWQDLLTIYNNGDKLNSVWEELDKQYIES